MDEVVNRMPGTADEAAHRLLRVVTQLLANTHPQHRATVTLDSSFERDLGIDSLGRAELLLRAEREFGVSLPGHALRSAETPRDLLRFTLTAHAPSSDVEKEVRVLTVEADQA